jgi:hypothetical protein
MAEPVPFPSKLFSLLSILEKIAIVVALLGVAFNYLRFTGANMLLMIGLSTLAGVYFLTGFRPPEKADDEQKLGFAALLATTILPKVSWIACAVLVIGIQFHLLHLPGATQQLQIGALAGAAAAVIFGFLVSQGNEHAKSQIGVLYRLVPMLIITSYFLMPPSA